jgi:hypothetical protein
MNVKKLNEIPEISPLQPVSYSMSINPNKKGKNTILNLEKLVTDFPLDITLDDNIVTHSIIPGFISKSYYQVQTDKKGGFNYSFPPKGPIETGFTCMYCEQNGPKYHKINCFRPFNSSLILSEETVRFPGAAEGTSYSLIVKKSGQKKVASKRARSQIFTDNIELFYEYPDESKCVVRISKNGSININYAKYADTDLPDILFFKINKVPGAIVEKPYNLISSYKYLVTGQFNIFPQRFNKQLLINLNILNNNLWETPIFKKKVGGKNVFMINKDYYTVTKYTYNSGEIVSRNNKLTNPYIIFTLTRESVKYTVQILLRGSVQIKASYIDTENQQEELTLNDIYPFLKKLMFNILVYSIESNYPIISEDLTTTPKKSKIKNTVDGKQPQVCQNRPGTKPGSGDFRPVPYSFYGVCPMEGYYNIPGGVKRPDGKYEPCCSKLKESGANSFENYANTLLNGYDVALPDNLSAVYVPGTKIIEPRGFSGLKKMNKKQIIDFLDDNGYLNKTIFKTDENGYTSFKNEVMESLNLLEYTPKKKITLTHSTFPKIGLTSYMVAPINNDTISVKLYIDKNGNGFFVNSFNDVTEANVFNMDLANTLIEGYLYPFEKWIFYAIDIIYYKNKDITSLNFYSKSFKNNRYNFLKSATEILKTLIPIELNYDLNVVSGSQYYLTSDETSSLLFMPLNNTFDILLWSDTLHNANTTIALNVQHLNANRWVISVGTQKIPTTLLQQGPQNDIEIPISFSKRYLTDSGIVLFKINLKKTDYTIEQRKPFTPLEILPSQINTYPEVITILESINNPINLSVFTELTTPPGFVLDHFAYYFNGIGEKLKVERT